MELLKMSKGIIKFLNIKYKVYIDAECFDIIKIKEICNLYNIKSSDQDSITLSEITITSPEFKKVSPKELKKNHSEILKSPEFIKKYSFFIKMLYACLKMGVELFNIDNNIIILKNNYQLIKSLELKKKQLITHHLLLLKTQSKNITHKIDSEYEDYFQKYIVKIKIIDTLMGHIHTLIKSEVVVKTDNLLTLILPYFYNYTNFIEVYNE